MNKETRPYTKAESRMLADTNRLADQVAGWSRSKTKLIATEESIKLWGNVVDYWNPLFRNDEYAINTRWGGIIAAPFYTGKFNMPRVIDMQINPDVGTWRGKYDGGETKWFRHIKPGNTFRVYNKRPIIEDITEGDGPRAFSLKSSSFLIDENNKVVCWETRDLTNIFLTKAQHNNGEVNNYSEIESMHKKDPYKYTDQELAFIRKTENAEEIRGAKIRYWEDVNVDDQPKPVITGPTTVIDMIQFSGDLILGHLPMRECRRLGGKQIVVDPVTKVSHLFLEGHFFGVCEDHGLPGIHIANYSRSLMARLVTNWMGDDGFLKEFSWKHYDDGREITRDIEFLKDKKSFLHDLIGDTLIAKGIVTGKRVENGESLVDLVVWIENLNGELGSAARAVVRLCSKSDEKRW